MLLEDVGFMGQNAITNFFMHNQIMSRLVKIEPPWQSICKTWKEEYTKWVTIHVVEKHDGIKNDIEKET